MNLVARYYGSEALRHSILLLPPPEIGAVAVDHGTEEGESASS